MVVTVSDAEHCEPVAWDSVKDNVISGWPGTAETEASTCPPVTVMTVAGDQVQVAADASTDEGSSNTTLNGVPSHTSSSTNPGLGKA